jgi:hypothetical protein
MVLYYYCNTIKSITSALLNKFKGMQVHRYAADEETLVNVINVPILFAPLSKEFLDRTENYTQEPESTGNRYYLTIPRLALNLTGITYNSERAAGVQEYRHFENVNCDTKVVDDFFRDVQPTPYDLNYTLSIRTDRLNDWSQIMENILPYFNPSLYLRIREFSFLNIERDIKVTLLNPAPDFSDQLDKTNVRQINGSIDFLVEGFVYKPIYRNKLIKIINTRFYVGYEDDDYSNVVEDSESSVSAYSPSASFPDDYEFSGYDADNNLYYFGKRESK